VSTHKERESGHVSTFELDLHWADGCPPGGALAAHVEDCVRCSAYLESLRATARDAQLVTPPPARIERPPSSNVKRWTGLAAAGVLAMAASIVLVMKGAPRDHGYVATKGTPAVEILVHRGQDTWIWDGRSPIRGGDTLALRVACEGMGRVAVAAPEGGHWERLSETECPLAAEPLPFTLRVDDQPGDEKLAVVLSQSTLDAPRLEHAITEAQQTGEVWAFRFVLPKAVPR
jgi:hypothetical protein